MVQLPFEEVNTANPGKLDRVVSRKSGFEDLAISSVPLFIPWCFGGKDAVGRRSTEP